MITKTEQQQIIKKLNEAYERIEQAQKLIVKYRAGYAVDTALYSIKRKLKNATNDIQHKQAYNE